MILKIINKTHAKIEKKIFKKTVKTALKKTKRKIKGDISLIFTDDPEIKKLNKKYRQKNKITDVLSFVNADLRGKKFVVPESADNYLGEIIISIPQAKRQAKEYGCSSKLELVRLFTHGFLHLLGYAHTRKKERAVMEKLENGIIQKYNY